MKTFLVCLLLFISNNSLAKDLFVSYLIDNNFDSREVASFAELEQIVNTKNTWDNHVIYFSTDKITVGVIFFKDDEQPNFFFSNTTVISFFSSEIVVVHW